MAVYQPHAVTPMNALETEQHYSFALLSMTAMRELPLREKRPKKLVEENSLLRDSLVEQLPAPDGSIEFKAGYRECMQTYALHAPNKRHVAKILDDYCITLEDACLRNMSRENIAQYEGYRQAIKDLRKQKRIR